MPGRQKWMRAKSRWPSRPAKRAVDAVLADRHQLMIELDVLRSAGRATKPVENARELLTRWWSSATWSRREDLLKSARWLIELAKNEHMANGASQHVLSEAAE